VSIPIATITSTSTTGVDCTTFSRNPRMETTPHSNPVLNSITPAPHNPARASGQLTATTHPFLLAAVPQGGQNGCDGRTNKSGATVFGSAQGRAQGAAILSLLRSKGSSGSSGTESSTSSGSSSSGGGGEIEGRESGMALLALLRSRGSSGSSATLLSSASCGSS
jgi:hypothetical protein